MPVDYKLAFKVKFMSDHIYVVHTHTHTHVHLIIYTRIIILALIVLTFSIVHPILLKVCLTHGFSCK